MVNKPHLYQSRAGHWYCSDGRWCGYGPTAVDAYMAWYTRDPEHSWVHNRPSAIQSRRRHATGGWAVKVVAE
jgi:hypothetical protein